MMDPQKSPAVPFRAHVRTYIRHEKAAMIGRYMSSLACNKQDERGVVIYYFMLAS